MAVEWIVPKGKTQEELDTDTAEVQKTEDVDTALKYLKETDYQIIRKAEEFLLAQGVIDTEFIKDREDARLVIREAETDLCQ